MDKLLRVFASIGVGVIWLTAGAFAATEDGASLFCLEESISPERPTWSEGGSKIAVGSYEKGIQVLELEARTFRSLTENPLDNWPSWQPNGNYVAFVRSAAEEHGSDRAALVLIEDSAGSEEQVLASEVRSGSAVRWSPSGKRVSILTRQGAMVIEPLAAVSRIVFPAPANDSSMSPEIRWADEDHVIVEIQDVRAQAWESYLVPIAGGSPAILWRGVRDTTVGHNGALWAIGTTPVGTPLMVIREGRRDEVLTGPVRSFDVDRHKGDVIASIDGRGLWLLSGQRERLQMTTGDDHEPSWSPKGDRIAFIRSVSGSFRLCVYRLGS